MDSLISFFFLLRLGGSFWLGKLTVSRFGNPTYSNLIILGRLGDTTWSLMNLSWIARDD